MRTHPVLSLGAVRCCCPEGIYEGEHPTAIWCSKMEGGGEQLRRHKRMASLPSTIAVHSCAASRRSGEGMARPPLTEF